MFQLLHYQATVPALQSETILPSNSSQPALPLIEPDLPPLSALMVRIFPDLSLYTNSLSSVYSSVQPPHASSSASFTSGIEFLEEISILPSRFIIIMNATRLFRIFDFTIPSINRSPPLCNLEYFDLYQSHNWTTIHWTYKNLHSLLLLAWFL